MRPVEVSDEQIIQAGNELLAEGRKVTGFALRNRLGSGSQPRLISVWRLHEQSKGDTEPTPDVQDLPIEIEDAIKVAEAKNTEFMRAMASNMQRIAARLAERRVADIVDQASRERENHQREIEDASATLDNLEEALESMRQQQAELSRQLAEAHEASNALSADNARLQERLGNAQIRINELEHENERLLEHHESQERQLASNQQAVILAEDRLAARERELNQLKLAHDAVSDMNIDRGNQLSAAEERIKGLSERVTDLMTHAEENRVALHRCHQSNLQLEKRAEKAESRAEQLQARLDGSLAGETDGASD